MKNPHLDATARKREARPLTVSSPELIVDGSDLAFRQMVHDILAFAARMQDNRGRVAASVGLSAQQYTMLLTIAQRQGQDGFGIIQVADHLGLSGAFVTIEVNKLVEAGLVRKRPNTVDRRRVLLTTTARARDLLESVNRVQRPSNDTIFGTLSRDEFETLRRVLPRLVEASGKSAKLIDFLTSEGNTAVGARQP